MTTLRRFCAIAALTLVLALPILADGQMEYPSVQPPPPCQSTATVQGQMVVAVNGPETGQVPGNATTDPLTEIVLSLIQSVLPLI